MKSNCLVFVLTLTAGFSTSESLKNNPKLFRDFLFHFHLSYGIIFYCEQISIDVSEIGRKDFKYLSFFDVSSSAFDLNDSLDIMRYDYSRLGILFDTTCNETGNVFEVFSKFSFFNASYIWLMTTDNRENVFNVLSSQNINLDAEITVAIVESGSNVTQLFDVYNPNSRTNGKLVTQPKGSWNDVDGLVITLSGSKFDRRSDLCGIYVHSGVVATSLPKNHTLLDYMESDKNTLKDAQHRHNYKLFNILSKKHNFKLLLHRAPLWGIHRNGTYDGVLGMFQENQIDISITPFRYTPDRFGFVDFAVVTWVTTPTIVFRHPQNGMRNIFLQPLKPWVWFTIALLTVLVAIFITVSIQLQYERKITMTFNRAFMMSIGILSQQGFTENLNNTSTRVILITTTISSLIIYQYYSSFIVSSLLTDSPKTIKTILQLIDSDIKVGIEDITYNVDFFETTTDKIALELYKRKVERKRNFYDVDKGLKMMKKGGFAFHVDTSYAYRLIQEMFSEQEICELSEMLLFPIRPLSNLLAKDSPFREFFVVGLQRLIETGIVDYHNKRWSAVKPKCVKSNQKIKSVDIRQAFAVFLLLAVAIVVCFVIMICEIIYFKCFSGREKRGKFNM